MGHNKALVCVAIGVDSVPEALALVVQENPHADVVEVRLDCFKDRRRTAPFFDVTDKPLLFTNRPDWEGGFFNGSEEDRISLLEQAVDQGAAYIDCELRASGESRKRVREKTFETKTNLILSWHDFKLTPSKDDLLKIVVTMQEQGADIGKIVTTAKDYVDVLHVLSLQEKAAELDFPLIAFCMGTPGVISRLATIQLGGYMTYCAPAGFTGTAAGQISCNYLRAILNLLQ